MPLTKLNYSPSHRGHYVSNLQLLEGVFRKADIEKVVPVENLANGRLRDNLDFLHWAQQYVVARYSSYDPRTGAHSLAYDATKERALALQSQGRRGRRRGGAGTVLHAPPVVCRRPPPSRGLTGRPPHCPSGGQAPRPLSGAAAPPGEPAALQARALPPRDGALPPAEMGVQQPAALQLPGQKREFPGQFPGPPRDGAVHQALRFRQRAVLTDARAPFHHAIRRSAGVRRFRSFVRAPQGEAPDEELSGHGRPPAPRLQPWPPDAAPEPALVVATQPEETGWPPPRPRGCVGRRIY